MWQQPLAETGYAAEGAFPLVLLLAPKVRAHIVLTGDPDDLDIFSSQMQAEPHVGNTLAQTSARWLSRGCYLSAPDHASGCPELRSASANQPLGPAKSALRSTRWSGLPLRGCDQMSDAHAHVTRFQMHMHMSHVHVHVHAHVHVHVTCACTLWGLLRG